MFIANPDDRITLPPSLTTAKDEYWTHLRVTSPEPWFWLRVGMPGASRRVVGHLLAIDEDVAEVLEASNRQLISLMCVYPHPQQAPSVRAEVKIVEVWRAQDRYRQDEPCLLLVADDGTEYGGRPVRAREGLRRVQLVARTVDLA
jgi:hypothetical protein